MSAQFSDDIHCKCGLTATSFTENSAMPNPFMFIDAKFGILLTCVHHLADWVFACKQMLISRWREDYIVIDCLDIFAGNEPGYGLLYFLPSVKVRYLIQFPQLFRLWKEGF